MTDTIRYCNLIEEIKARISLVPAIAAREITTKRKALDIEISFLQFRKALELIAFSSLVANKAEYATAYADFAKHWSATRMLKHLEKVNPEFYPVPLHPPRVMPDGRKHFERVAEGFLTQEDFVFLYDRCSKILHSRNPFSSEDPNTHLRFTVKHWVERIQNLLRWHTIRLVNGTRWVVAIPNEGKVQLWPAQPR